MFDSKKLDMTSVINLSSESVVELPVVVGQIGGAMGVATATARVYVGRLTDHYKNAYRIAAATVRLGNLVKQGALVLAGAVMLGGMVVSTPNDPIQNGSFNWLYLLGGLFGAVVILAAGYIRGAFLTAQGQFLSALLDTAVNTSPHLQDLEKVSIMSL